MNGLEAGRQLLARPNSHEERSASLIEIQNLSSFRRDLSLLSF